MSSTRFQKNCVFSLIISIIALAPQPATAQQPPENPLQFVPADALFCIRINNFDAAISAIDQYAEGLAPPPLTLAMLSRMPLIQIVGDPMLKNIRFDGDFAVFGLENGDPGNVLFAFIMPVTDYETFLREHPNATQPDENGISRLKMGSADAKILVRKAGSWAVLTDTRNYDRMVEIARQIGDNKLKTVADTIDPRSERSAQRSPIWLYANIQRAGNAFGPAIFKHIEKAAQELEKAGSAQTGIAHPGKVMDIYVQAFKHFFAEVDSITWSVRPAADVCRISTNIKPVEGKDLEQALKTSSPPRGPNALLPYIKDGSMLNVAAKIDKPLWKRFYSEMFALLGSITGDSVRGEDLEKFKKLTNEGIEAFGEALVFSMDANAEARPPFDMKYYARIADIDTFNRVLDEEIELINAGTINDIYKGMGLEMNFQANRNAATYKGVAIDSARVSFRTAEAESQMDQAIKAMYGEGLEYRWAIVDDLIVYAISGDVDKDIRAMIDQVKAGAPQEPAKEISEALSYLPNARNADAMGTFNWVRMMQMAMGMAATMEPDQAVPQIDVSTESNLAWAARVRNGRIIIDAALPKKHLLELKTAGELMQRKMMESHQRQAEPAETGPML